MGNFSKSPKNRPSVTGDHLLKGMGGAGKTQCVII
jgi:hypothetical protein